MKPLPRPEPLYLDTEPDATFATFHRPPAGQARATAVLLCPPFGFDEVCAYRSLREWAMRLAADGYPALRISLPGTGDSGGSPHGRDRLGAWSAAVEGAAGWCKNAASADRVVAIGIGLGGVVARVAVASGSPIDDLVLWGVQARGRAVLRQLRAFSKLERSLFYEDLDPPPPIPEDEIEAGGFVLSAETVHALDSLDLTALPLPNPRSRRILLLERDGLAIDADLSRHLDELGVDLSTGPGEGFASMTSHPQEAVPPLSVIAHVSSWLASSPAPAVVSPGATPPGSGPIGSAPRLAVSDTGVTETPLVISQPFGDLSAILVEPPDRHQHGLCVVLLNAGAVRRIGPGRMWVQAARGWAQRGVPTLRLDVEGIGDADGDGAPYRSDGALYAPRLIPQVIAAIDHLQNRGIGERFVLGGLCAGAYWSFHAALNDPRVSAAMMLNPRALVWETGLESARDLRVLLRERPSAAKIRRVATPARVRALVRWLLGAPVRWLHAIRSPAGAATLDSAVGRLLDRLLQSDKRALFLFSAHESLHDELVRSGRMSPLERSTNVTVEYVPVRDHTMRPGWAQRHAIDAMDRAVERELAARPELTA